MIEFVLFSLTGAAMLLIAAYMFLEYCEKQFPKRESTRQNKQAT